MIRRFVCSFLTGLTGVGFVLLASSFADVAGQ